MRRRWFNWLLMLSLWLSASASLAQEECVAADGEALVIGAIFPTESLFAASAAEPYQGAEAMRLAINACGGVNGRPLEFALVSVSSRSGADDAVRDLAAAGIPLIVGSGTSAAAEGAWAAAVNAGVVYWEVTEPLDSRAGGLGSGWLYSPRPTNFQMGQHAAAFATDAFGAARVALVTDQLAPSAAFAAGVRDLLEQRGLPLPAVEARHEDSIPDVDALARQIRGERVDVLLLSLLDGEALNLWYALRQADANLQAWMQLGAETYRRDLCSRGINLDGLIGVGAMGETPAGHWESIGGATAVYADTYLNRFGRESSPAADLSASGVLLLRAALTLVEGELTPSAIRAALQRVNVDGVGLFGDGLRMNDDGSNALAASLIRQQQGRTYCTLSPDAITTCAELPMSFPTWRERAFQEQGGQFFCDPLV
jgi:ABC-type branched-subunit amino acid transport system substrate-binding protein